MRGLRRPLKRVVWVTVKRTKATIKRHPLVFILLLLFHAILLLTAYYETPVFRWFYGANHRVRWYKNWSYVDLGCEQRKDDIIGLPVYVADQCKTTGPAAESSKNQLSHCNLMTCRNLLSGTLKDNAATLDLERITTDFMNAFPYRLHISDSALTESTSDCERYRNMMGFNQVPVTPEAIAFPLAYNLLLHKDAHQVSRLLRAIYRPQNVYCIHVDRKSPKSFRDAVGQLSKCFDNVRLASRMETITYAGFSRLKADINCMQDHVNTSGARWRYLINTAGQAFPLRTNEEIVSILRLYNGTNVIEGLDDQHVMKERYIDEWRESIDTQRKPILTGRTNPPPPHGLKIVKGSAYGAFSRDFMQFVIKDCKSRDLLEWLRTTFSPDEYYWATLHHALVNPQLNTPGRSLDAPSSWRYLMVYVEWLDPNHPQMSTCRGKALRDICVFGVGDLPTLVRRPELFANKFDTQFEPLALDCLELWLRHKETCSDCEPFVKLEYYRKLLTGLN